MPIRRLSSTLVNRIAAGEGVERPAAAVKEIVENALDAGAKRINIVLRDGGQSEIRVTDNGHGMTRDELMLAVERHASSNLSDGHRFKIQVLCCRGEDSPSNGAAGGPASSSRAR